MTPIIPINKHLFLRFWVVPFPANGSSYFFFWGGGLDQIPRRGVGPVAGHTDASTKNEWKKINGGPSSKRWGGGHRCCVVARPFHFLRDFPVVVRYAGAIDNRLLPIISKIVTHSVLNLVSARPCPCSFPLSSSLLIQCLEPFLT